MDARSVRWLLTGPIGLLLLFFGGVTGRKHQLHLTDEKRSIIQVNSFGFFANGTLEVNMKLRLVGPHISLHPIGLSLSHAKSGQFLSSPEQESLRCIFDTEPVDKMFLILNFTSSCVHVKMSGNLKDVKVSDFLSDEEKVESLKTTPGHTTPSLSTSPSNKESDQKKKAPLQKRDIEQPTPGEKSMQISASSTAVKSDGPTKDLFLSLESSPPEYRLSFRVVFGSKEQGLYNLYFHNCNNLREQPTGYNITIDIKEKNPGGYLSAAEIPLFKLYLIMAGSFFTASIIWVYMLHKHKYSVFKIHWLMAALVFTKSIALLFHSVNYYFINKEGHPLEGLAVMYYITHVLKGVLLFITIVLIGTGWAFVKYILSDKDKKIFMIVLPLQVLANVAYIIMESSETGTSDYALWTQIVFLVDLICCGAILFPVIWSIRHLQEASSTDGKAAMNLAKLKLFRHYYIMIVCYIYFTRIIAILLKVTVSFQLQWLHEMLVEVSTLVFFVLTGYKFRPASNNPYLQLPQEDEDIQMDEVLTESGVLGGVTRVNKTFNGPETL
ncbi:hypothetical protein NDU88_001364 [Pleurodeles waltl]|uniref:GOST seven transmembrane domain-containing protein n=1 Tax=Pleurodeles waltl TaxID=8319 RepID=A0AAV7S750_PLEWA|nr:hypothetical protein NDU88_001364 [Pleurodeles waltl]